MYQHCFWQHPVVTWYFYRCRQFCWLRCCCCCCCCLVLRLLLLLLLLSILLLLLLLLLSSLSLFLLSNLLVLLLLLLLLSFLLVLLKQVIHRHSYLHTTFSAKKRVFLMVSTSGSQFWGQRIPLHFLCTSSFFMPLEIIFS